LSVARAPHGCRAGLHADFAERIELVDEHDARGLGFGLGTDVDVGGADPDEHLDELDPLRLKNGTCASPATARARASCRCRRADQQHALRNPAAEIVLGVLEELDTLSARPSTPATSVKRTTCRRHRFARGCERTT
jgi:hypothetical protein